MARNAETRICNRYVAPVNECRLGTQLLLVPPACHVEQSRDTSTSLGMRGMEQFTIVDLASPPRKKTGTRFLPAPLFRRTILRVLWADDRVVGEVQIVRSSAIEIDPTLDHVAVSRIDTHRQR